MENRKPEILRACGPRTQPGVHGEGRAKSDPSGKLLFVHELLMAPCQRQDSETSKVFTAAVKVRKLGLVLWANQNVMRPHPPGRVS